MCIAWIGAFGFLFMPVFRVVVISLPAIGTLYVQSIFPTAKSSGLSDGTKKKFARIGTIKVIFALIWAFLIEFFMLVGYRAPGAMIMYGGCAALGLFCLLEGAWAYSMALSLAQSEAQAEPALKTGKGEPKKIEPDKAALRPGEKKDLPLTEPVLIFMIVALVTVIIFYPPMEKYSGGPDLKITYAQFTSSKRYSITVYNGAAAPTSGTVELWVNNGTNRTIVSSTNRIGGFEEWSVSGTFKNITCKASYSSNCNAEVVYKGKVLNTQKLAMPFLCGMIPVSFISLTTTGLYSLRPQARRHQKCQ
jgi:hypothetical protein